ncbi:MAG: uracil-DNA glycosylase [Candidatus Nealsonbacteria bacterium]
MKLDKLIRKCKRCPLWKSRINAVPGEGSKKAKIMFVGEAPGAKEDETGRPFCGRSGKLLDELLEKNKIKRKEVYITSVLKCRPPKNRLPKKGEIEFCRKWLKEQIKIVKPRVIVLLGRVAFEEIIGKKEFSKFRGKFFRKDNQLYFAVYHPAAGLRSPKKIRKVLEKDFKKLFL